MFSGDAAAPLTVTKETEKGGYAESCFLGFRIVQLQSVNPSRRQ